MYYIFIDTFEQREEYNWRFYKACRNYNSDKRHQLILIYTDVGHEDLSKVDLSVSRFHVHAAVCGLEVDEPLMRRVNALVLKKSITMNSLDRSSSSPEEFRQFLDFLQISPEMTDSEIDDKEVEISKIFDGYSPPLPVNDHIIHESEVLFGLMHGLLIKMQFHESEIER